MAIELGNLRLSDRDRLYDVVTVKRYGNRYKLTYHKHGVKRGGLDRPNADGEGTAVLAGSPDERFSQSLSRTRAAVFELAACNPWEWFCTFTLADDRGFDRHDLGPWHRCFSQWVRNQRRLHGCELHYLIVPEAHKDGAWHMHALMMGLPLDRLRAFNRSEKLPYRLLKKLAEGQRVFDWPAYRERFGWVTVEPIRDRDRCASYIAKYVTKAIGELSLCACSHMYYASQGLQRAELLAVGHMHISAAAEDACAAFRWDYENDYVAVCWADEPHWLGVIDLL